ncbi:MAG: DUF1521 domain-containing protein [Deltaproteobacteria bacterium]|nr:DUF1521 domain-containing protein [Deltaproteobacteria bacterium]
MQVDPATGVVITPGGFKIEQLGQYEWKITGPDGSSTRIWGDPHVAESDGGAWDFKKNSSFVLPDGTIINVNTKKFGDMTVTSGLDIINGNDRVQVTGIDAGKGQVGQVTGDGKLALEQYAANELLVMGETADDWSYSGKEVVGSEGGGDSLKLGSDLKRSGLAASDPMTNLSSLIPYLSQAGDLKPALNDVAQMLRVYDAQPQPFRLQDQLSR